ncbi:MAG: hypothetical protein CVV64_05445 [Candidatus Wallbacteria bacterium HGW-Wallbacteria-1]|jgi:hypothetical protein|uniref:Uncharacterized protein n=1 Tax=Candidatus Wallbacteria bacterium HGW-Wallbacteria-1 TaxID=2013854 RepID=A0A2N1PSA6_9BACT|nr:MAG: hypothetical protein CVV64_05445 [Candidatus Wallbacteria bacterium HGW-Wallbacteria-1]
MKHNFQLPPNHLQIKKILLIIGFLFLTTLNFSLSAPTPEPSHLSETLQSLTFLFNRGFSAMEDVQSIEAAGKIILSAGFEQNQLPENQGLFHCIILSGDPYKEQSKKNLPLFFRMRTIILPMDIRKFSNTRNSTSMLREATQWHEEMMTSMDPAFVTPELSITLPEGSSSWETEKFPALRKLSGFFIAPLLREMDIRNNTLDRELNGINPEHPIFERIQEIPFSFNLPMDKIICSGASYVKEESRPTWKLFRMGRVMRARIFKNLIHGAVEIHSNISDQEKLAELAEMALTGLHDFVSLRRKLIQDALDSLPPEIPRPVYVPEADAFLVAQGTEYAGSLSEAIKKEFQWQISKSWPVDGWKENGLPRGQMLKSLGAGPAWNDETVIRVRYPVAMMEAILKSPLQWFLNFCKSGKVIPDHKLALSRIGWKDFEYRDPVETPWRKKKENSVFPDYETFRKAYIKFFSEQN